MPVGAGIAVAGVGSAVLSSRAAKSAAETGAEGAERSGAQIQAAADRARGDVLNFFPAARQDLLAGASAAGDLLAGGIGEQQRLLSAGNVGAQGTLGAGFGQVQNALLGLPVNQQAFAPQQIPLSQPLQNPLAQTFGGGAPGGLFSDLSQNVEQLNVDELVEAAKGGVTLEAVTAKQDLIDMGLNLRGEQSSASEEEDIRVGLRSVRNASLVRRAAGSSAGPSDTQFAIEELRKLGLDKLGQPLTSTPSRTTTRRGRR